MKTTIRKINFFMNKMELKYPILMRTIDSFLIILCIYLAITLLLCLKRSNDIKILNLLQNDGVVVILASLLGATVGGIITYFVSTRSLIQSNHIRSAVINKKTIYEPLHSEYRGLLKDIKNQDVFRISFEASSRGNYSSLEAWNRIKNDSRFYQLPEYLKVDLLVFEEDILNYSEQVDEINNSAFDFFEKLLKYKGFQIVENKSGIRSFFITERLVARQLDILKEGVLRDKVLGLPELSEEIKFDINNEFNAYITNDENIIRLKESKKKLINKLEGILEIIELIIITITNKFERQSNIF